MSHWAPILNFELKLFLKKNCFRNLSAPQLLVGSKNNNMEKVFLHISNWKHWVPQKLCTVILLSYPRVISIFKGCHKLTWQLVLKFHSCFKAAKNIFLSTSKVCTFQLVSLLFPFLKWYKMLCWKWKKYQLKQETFEQL